MINPTYRYVKPMTGCYIPTMACIASGKSVFTRALGEAIEQDTGKHCYKFFEPCSDDEEGGSSRFLPLFYKNMKRWGFTVQIEMLLKRRKQSRFARILALQGDNSVADSDIRSDGVFVNMLQKDGMITQEEADLYYELFQDFCEPELYPTAIVYLDCTPETCLRRLNKRMSEVAGRNMESDISISYLRNLISEYKELISNMSRFCHIIRLPWDEDKTQEQINDEARKVWEQVKFLREKYPIPCQLGL